MYLVGIFKRLSLSEKAYNVRWKPISLVFLAFLLNKLEAQSTASLQVTKFEIAAPQLDTVKTIWVYLPKDYKSTETNYPVIYMHDAQNLFDTETSYVGEWEVDEYMDKLIDNESIIIGIEHGNEKRTDELTPFENEKYGGGKADRYLNFIKNSLKPHIDAVYRTKPEPSNTSIFGSSFGGLVSFYAVLKYPETFGKAGVFSPSFWFNREIYDWVNASTIPETTKFYFLAGTDESETMVTDQERMVALLKEKGLKDSQINSQSIEGGQHNEKFWATHFGNAYQWLFND